MNWICTLLPLLLLAAPLPPSGKGQFVADISSDTIELRHDFAGADLLLFGAIGSGNGDPDIVLSVTGPADTVMVRRKERVSGLWINRESLRLEQVPGYFALLSSNPLADIAPRERLSSLGLLPDSQPSGVARTAQTLPFIEGFRRGMTRRGLWVISEGSASIREQALFRASLSLPSNVPVGHYRVRAFLFRGGELLAMRELGIDIDKTGLERALFDVSRSRPLLYGLAAVAIALLAGWGASLITDRR